MTPGTSPDTATLIRNALLDQAFFFKVLPLGELEFCSKSFEVAVPDIAPYQETDPKLIHGLPRAPHLQMTHARIALDDFLASEFERQGTHVQGFVTEENLDRWATQKYLWMNPSTYVLLRKFKANIGTTGPTIQYKDKITYLSRTLPKGKIYAADQLGCSQLTYTCTGIEQDEKTLRGGWCQVDYQFQAVRWPVCWDVLDVMEDPQMDNASKGT